MLHLVPNEPHAVECTSLCRLSAHDPENAISDTESGSQNLQTAKLQCRLPDERKTPLPVSDPGHLPELRYVVSFYSRWPVEDCKNRMAGQHVLLPAIDVG